MAWMGMSMELVKSIWILAQTVKRTLAVQETQVQSLDQEDPLEKEMATHSSILAWIIPWTEAAWWATFHGLKKVRHD